MIMKSAANSEQKEGGGFGAGGAGDPRAVEFPDSCEVCLHLVLVPLLECLKKKLCSASPEVKQNVLAQIQVRESRMKSKAELLHQLMEIKKELELHGTAKVIDSTLKVPAVASGRLPNACGASVGLSKL